MQNETGTHSHIVFGKVAMALHWMMAVIIIGLLLFGQSLIGDHGRSWTATVHASLGFLILGLVPLRILWRLKHPPPPPIAETPRWQVLAARGSHALFYILMIVIPLAGWFAFTEHVKRNMGVPSASFFWITKIPLLPDFGVNFHFIHKLAGKVAIGLIALHILAALKHQFIDRDNTLNRMTPWGR